MEKKLTVRDMAYTAMFAVVMAACSWISVPYVVPFTMQTFAVFLAVGVLGGKRGTLAVLVYILLGCVGIPVFSGFSGGVGILMGSTGGYIVGFLWRRLSCGSWRRFPATGRRYWPAPWCWVSLPATLSALPGL